jgi:hypothetical protein
MGPFGQPPMPGALPPDPMGGGGMPMPPQAMGDMMGMISGLARMERKTPMDQTREAIDLLKEVRERDPKQGKRVTMAIHMLRHGEKDLEKFGVESSKETNHY